MITTKLAKKVLTKREQTHLRLVAGIRSMKALEIQVAFMRSHEKPDCFTCVHIASKLGVWERRSKGRRFRNRRNNAERRIA